jgi:shikimate dehydrogenase
MGSPIAHSLSPALHTAAYRSLGLTGWTYDVREVDAAGLGPALDRLGPEWVGVSLTMPLKQAVLPLLDEVTDLAAAVGAVNTLTLTDGRRLGDNTDVHGIVAAFRAAGVTDADGAVILGGGATAASALAAVGALGERQPVVAVRSTARAGALLEAAERLQVTPRLVPWEGASDLVRSAPLVVSTVPAGAADGLAAQLAGGAPGRPGVLLDVVYRPWPTALARSWAAGGGTAVPGLDMLLHQAARQVEIWTGSVADLMAMRTAAQAVLDRRDGS